MASDRCCACTTTGARHQISQHQAQTHAAFIGLLVQRGGQRMLYVGQTREERTEAEVEVALTAMVAALHDCETMPRR